MKFTFPVLCAGVLVAASPAVAEVTEVDETGFVTRDEATVEADSQQTWLALTSPAKYWNSGHTWSGDAANMKLTPQAGGCFCEKIPENTAVDRVTFEGSVEHMRVIHAFPERALRMSGALGPLQSEPVTGVLTVALSPTDAGGTRIVWEYHVGGRTRFDKDMIARAVDGVMSQQLNGLADLLGRVSDAAAEDTGVDDDASDVGDAGAASDSDAAEPSAESNEANNSASDEGVEKPSVAEAFKGMEEGR